MNSSAQIKDIISSAPAPVDAYAALLASKSIGFDLGQKRIVDNLQVMFDYICSDTFRVRGQGFFRKFRSKNKIPARCGTYLWGGVGRGKTHLADTLFACLPVDDKLRLHFHRFMQQVHRQLDRHKATQNPLDIVGEHFAEQAGVLFLDELGEFPATVLDALRQPLEEGTVRVARAHGAASFPARFVLVGATNPCPCGEGDPVGPRGCRCAPAARTRYLRRISGPLLDRFDLRVHVTRPRSSELFARTRGEPTHAVAERVAAARAVAEARGVPANVAISAGDADELAPLSAEAEAVLIRAVDDGRLSARGVHRVRCVARTIADLDGHVGPVEAGHVAAALALRPPVLEPLDGVNAA